VTSQPLTRRIFIRIAAGLTAGTALAGCSPQTLLQLEPELGDWPGQASESTWRLLNRITFGPRPDERDRVATIGPAAFIEEQLAPDTLPAMATRPRLALRRLESLHLDAPDLFDVEPEVASTELQRAALLRAVYSPAQLVEAMIDFWSDHFSIAQTKGDCAWLKTIDDRDVIRPHALGNFHDLLYASAHSPAMLIYLDNQQNHAGNPNENYARELLELHTLSVDGGYTQTDVQEVARCLTGWTVKDHFYRGRFTFDPDHHDDGAKRVLGLDIPAGAKKRGGEQVIDMLAEHPATAHFIATKLVRRFVADDPPPQLVAQAARTFIETQGDIKAILRTILFSPQMLNLEQEPVARKLKRPFEYIASALRALNATTDGGPALLTYLAEMGQPLFQWPTPDGFPDRAEAWLGTLFTRWRFALALANDNLPGTQLDLPALANAANARTRQERLNQFAILLLGYPLSPTITEQLLQSGHQDQTLLVALLGSPAFQWK
jgi:uncharacterized protein (DUF1800 family)